MDRATLNAEPEQRFIRLAKALGVGSFGINAIVLEPRQRNRIHRHKTQEEVFLVLEGELTLVVEGKDEIVKAGELVRVEPQVRRQLTNKSTRPVKVLALGGAVDHQHQGRDGEAFNSWSQTEPSAIADVPVPPDLPAES